MSFPVTISATTMCMGGYSGKKKRKEKENKGKIDTECFFFFFS